MSTKQKTIDDLQQKVIDLESTVKSLKESHQQEVEMLNNDLVTERKNHEDALLNLNDSHENQINALDTEKNTEINWLKEQLEEYKKEIENKKLQLDQKELKKLASSYKEQESEYSKDILFWKKCLFYAGWVLIACFFFSMIFSSWKLWYEKFEYYVIDVILLSVLWFCSSQYSDSVKLRNDYANRKTLAQSFSNILNSLPEDEDIKDKFIEKTTDVLCAPSIISNNEPILSKEVLKQAIELWKLVTSK